MAGAGWLAEIAYKTFLAVFSTSVLMDGRKEGLLQTSDDWPRVPRATPNLSSTWTGPGRHGKASSEVFKM